MRLLFACLFVAFPWTVGFVLSRKANADIVTLAMLGCLATGLVAVPFAAYGLYTGGFATLSRHVATYGLSGGAFNGLGLAMLFVLFALAGKQDWQVSHIVPIAYALTIIFTTIAGRMFLGEVLTTYKLISMTLLTAGTAFLVVDK